MLLSYGAWLRIAVILAALYLLSQVTPVYLPIILAVVLAFILNPVVNRIVAIRLVPLKRYVPRSLASILAILFATIMISGMVTFIFTPFISEFNRFFTNLPDLIEKIQHLTGVLEKRAHAIELPAGIQGLIDQGLSSATAWALALGRRVLDSTIGFASKIVELVVVPVLTYYFLKDWRELKASTVEAFSLPYRAKAATIIEEMGLVISGYIRGQALLSVVIGFMVFVGMLILNVDYPLVLGLLATLTEAIPIIGPIIGATPAIFLAYLDSPSLAVKVLIFFLLIHQIENHILVPKIMGRTIDLHPVVVIISLLVGGQLLGIVGMVLAVPVVALLKVLLKHLWRFE